MTNTIHITLTYHWFDKIESGKKTAEYRKYCVGWENRLKKLKPGDCIVFHRGYTDRTITRIITKIRVILGWDLPKAEYEFFGCPNEEYFFEISFENQVLDGI